MSRAARPRPGTPDRRSYARSRLDARPGGAVPMQDQRYLAAAEGVGMPDGPRIGGGHGAGPGQAAAASGIRGGHTPPGRAVPVHAHRPPQAIADFELPYGPHIGGGGCADRLQAVADGPRSGREHLMPGRAVPVQGEDTVPDDVAVEAADRPRVARG